MNGRDSEFNLLKSDIDRNALPQKRSRNKVTYAVLNSIFLKLIQDVDQDHTSLRNLFRALSSPLLLKFDLIGQLRTPPLPLNTTHLQSLEHL